jgi:hypothetical protein
MTAAPAAVDTAAETSGTACLIRLLSQITWRTRVAHQSTEDRGFRFCAAVRQCGSAAVRCAAVRQVHGATSRSNEHGATSIGSITVSYSA